MQGTGRNRGDSPLRVAHFVQRYPPALGGSEAYFSRLSRYLAAQGAAVVSRPSITALFVPNAYGPIELGAPVAAPATRAP